MTLLGNLSPPLIQETLPHKMSVLDLFLPGFSNITNAASQALNGNMSGYSQLMCLFALAALLRPYLYQLIDCFLDYFTSTVHVKEFGETYDMIQAWISSRALDNASRSIVARVRTKQRNQRDYDASDNKALQYAPWQGAFYFWYRKNLFYYRTVQVNAGLHQEERVSITCIGRSLHSLKGFMEECRLEYLNKSKNKTTVYVHRGDSWRKNKAVAVRPLSSVILDRQQKELLITDIERFLDPKTKQRYFTHSIPYKRGYLLYGPPGTGKTSFSLSIAGALDMDIYVVSIPGMNDEKLKDIFDALPDRCVVLLEDIDASGATCSRGFGQKDSDKNGDTRPQKIGATLSGLLNALDGVSSQEDRVLIMTTNHPENLDHALTRPGRVDLKIEFQLATKWIAKEIYRFMFKQPGDGFGVDSQQGEHDEKIEEHAEEFATKVPESEFSPAEVMAYLLQHWNSPADAVRHCDQWVDGLLKEKEG